MRDQVIIVTGGSRGIGRATVRRLLADGASVVATGRDASSLETLESEMGSARLMTIAGDATDETHQREAVARAHDRFGRIDGLVNNAGAHDAEGPILAHDDDRFRNTWEANVVAVRAWVRATAHLWSAESPGSVVNVASVAGLKGEPLLGTYGVTKAAQIHLSEQLALELAPHVRVNVVAPGFTVTTATEKVARTRGAELTKLYPLGRLVDPSDVAAAIAFLLSADAAMITGQTMAVDGGFLLTLPGGYVPSE